ncbi:MAG: hypothetical protein E7311_00045 [Clostridiales bacterium]|nr:hypothetical protein [Clostridiales bacterium]
MLNKIEIPKMPSFEIARHYERIKPIVRDKLHTPFYVRELSEKELSCVAYTALKAEDKFYKAANLENMTPICTVKMLHKWGYYGFFKPSVGEVIRQIPTELRDKVVAFEIIKQLPTSEHYVENDAGYHVSEVKLYAKKAG